ncbi:MAG: DUF4124 domain-containing protein [Burkholderiales bacterium]|nr:DUF4124 domain-containing protein [Burkholderiales bacterium]
MSRHLSFPSSVRQVLGVCIPLILLGSTPAWALYKVVGPDGRVTYTDRPPVDRPAVAIKANASSTAATDNLPFELKRIAARYPVVLYTSAKCVPCDTGRQTLQSRGIPFVEKSVQTDEDIKELMRLESSNQMPILKVGSKKLLGFSPSEWTTYLDAAGYPAQSALPSSYRQPAASPLTTPAASETAAGTTSPQDSGTTSPTGAPGPEAQPSPKTPPGFKF